MDIRTLEDVERRAAASKDKPTVLAIRAAIREIAYLRLRDTEYSSEIEHLKRVIADNQRKLANIEKAWELCARWPDTAEEIKRLDLAISDQEF